MTIIIEERGVPGGWILENTQARSMVKDGQIVEGWDYNVTLLFVPDPKNEWDLSEYLI